MIIQSLLYMIVSLTVFLVLTEILTIDISYGDQTVIDFDLMIFGLRFTQSKTNTKKGRKKRFRPDFYTVKNTLDELLSKSDLNVRSVEIYYPYGEVSANAIKVGACNSILSAILAYAEANSKKFKLGKITYADSANNNYKIVFNVNIELSLLSFLNTVIKLRLQRKSRKVKSLWQKAK